jgi:hypothetical protein
LNANQTVAFFVKALSLILVREFDQRSHEQSRFENMKTIAKSVFRYIACSAAGLCRQCAEFRRLRQLLPCRQQIAILKSAITSNEVKKCVTPFISLIGIDRILDAFEVLFDVPTSKKNEPSLLIKTSILSPQKRVFLAKTNCIFSCLVRFPSSLLSSIICATN